MTASNSLHLIAALGVAAALIWVSARCLARLRPGLLARARPGSQRLAIDAAVSIDAKRRIVLLRCDGRHALLLTSPHGDLSLGWLPPGHEGVPPGRSA